MQFCHATSSKFDLSPSSLDKPLYTAQRGSNKAASLDRSCSFRECTTSSLPNMLRSSSPTTHRDVESFFNYVHFDKKLLVLDQKSNRHVDYKRHVNAALGISPDESPSSSAKEKLPPCLIPEDVKRMRDSLYLSTVKAREHVKMFDEALSVLNVKKKSRVEGFSSDRSSVMLNDRSISGPSKGKVGPKVGLSSKLLLTHVVSYNI
ncbi:serine/arginine repetitive matrix protein [Trifolium repens]|nr:serine/arginine repetitive matrix protein [Trifolium repens]